MTKDFAVGTAILFRSPCTVCKRGSMAEIIRLTVDERIEYGCGKLLLVECTNGGREAWAYRDKTTQKNAPAMTMLEMLDAGILP